MEDDNLDDLLRASPDAYVVSDASGTIRVWNPAAEMIFGYTEEEAVGRSLDIIIPERLRERHWNAYKDAMRTGETRYSPGDLVSLPAMRKDAEQIWVQFSVVPIHNDGEGLYAVAVTMRDVTNSSKSTVDLAGWPNSRLPDSFCR